MATRPVHPSVPRRVRRPIRRLARPRLGQGAPATPQVADQSAPPRARHAAGSRPVRPSLPRRPRRGGHLVRPSLAKRRPHQRRPTRPPLPLALGRERRPCRRRPARPPLPHAPGRERRPNRRRRAFRSEEGSARGRRKRCSQEG